VTEKGYEARPDRRERTQKKDFVGGQKRVSE